MSGSYKQGGFERSKYIITKTNGDPIDPKARYFVLRYDADPHARIALTMYAESVRPENRRLANELIAELVALAENEAAERGE